MKEPIELQDIDGREIYEGDIVEYRVDYDFSIPPVPNYNTSDGTLMIDTVVIINGQSYFWDNENNRGGFAWRHAKYCRVIGSVYDQEPIMQIINENINNDLVQ